jgi:adenylate cyclase class 2
MPEEKEAKFRVSNHLAVRRALRKAGAECLGTALQTDRYFDFPDAALRRSDRGLRIRTVRVLRSPKGKLARPGKRIDLRPLVTFKGPRRPGKIKIRPEFQTTVDDAEALEEILRACGLSASLTIQKRRSSFRLDRCRVELDELPLLGCFVEVEGPSEGAIRGACRKLGLRGEPITDAYTKLVSEYCRAHGLDAREIRFE